MKSTPTKEILTHIFMKTLTAAGSHSRSLYVNAKKKIKRDGRGFTGGAAAARDGGETREGKKP